MMKIGYCKRRTGLLSIAHEARIPSSHSTVPSGTKISENEYHMLMDVNNSWHVGQISKIGLSENVVQDLHLAIIGGLIDIHGSAWDLSCLHDGYLEYSLGHS